MSIVYDVGMYNGDDTAYYLAKGFDVVAIEANPDLCEQARQRFAAELDQGRLSILNFGVGESEGALDFYVHRFNPVLSTFLPGSCPLEQFQVVNIEVKKLSQLVGYFGRPHFIKIDVEGLDAVCLRDLLMHGVVPPYISAEAHTVDTYCTLVGMGYPELQLVNGSEVGYVDATRQIATTSGSREFHFNPHSSGPFGDDLTGDWVDKDEMLRRWIARGPGWFDIHGRRRA